MSREKLDRIVQTMLSSSVEREVVAAFRQARKIMPAGNLPIPKDYAADTATFEAVSSSDGHATYIGKLHEEVEQEIAKEQAELERLLSDDADFIAEVEAKRSPRLSDQQWASHRLNVASSLLRKHRKLAEQAAKTKERNAVRAPEKVELERYLTIGIGPFRQLLRDYTNEKVTPGKPTDEERAILQSSDSSAEDMKAVWAAVQSREVRRTTPRYTAEHATNPKLLAEAVENEIEDVLALADCPQQTRPNPKRGFARSPTVTTRMANFPNLEEAIVRGCIKRVIKKL